MRIWPKMSSTPTALQVSATTAWPMVICLGAQIWPLYKFPIYIYTCALKQLSYARELQMRRGHINLLDWVLCLALEFLDCAEDLPRLQQRIKGYHWLLLQIRARYRLSLRRKVYLKVSYLLLSPYLKPWRVGWGEIILSFSSTSLRSSR